MEQRGQFTFYRSYWDSLRELPKKDRLPILEAIISYGLDGPAPAALTSTQKAIFLLVKPTLESGRKKSANGKQGGKQTGSKQEANRKQTLSKPEANDKQTASEKEIEIEKEIEVEIEKEIEVEIEKEVEVDVEKEGSAIPSAASAADRKLKYLSGSLGQGVVALTDQQMEDLLDRMGLDMFDHYVRKLSDFILSKGASVKSHYDTILSWYTQDCALRGVSHGR